MRLKTSRSGGSDELLRVVAEGYRILRLCELDFEEHMRQPAGDEGVEVAKADRLLRNWASAAIATLEAVFPTQRETFMFLRMVTQAKPAIANEVYVEFRGLVNHFERAIRRLDKLRLRDLGMYTDLPIAARLYIEDIDSFSKVRDVNPALVSDVLTKGGRLELSEDRVQVALEQVLDVPFHRRDWGGEINDLYTANVVVNGARTSTGFALKGNGCTAPELRIRDCGKNGDQLVRLVESPADIFVVQYVGPVSDAVIKDIAGKVEHRRGLGLPAWFCVIDGQDTARLLKAYGKLPPKAAFDAARLERGRRRSRKRPPT